MDLLKEIKNLPPGLPATGTGLFLVAVWFGIAGIDYHAANPGFPYVTAGWFILGFPFFMTFALAYAALWGVLSRYIGLIGAWIAQICCSAAFIAYAIVNNSVSATAAEIIGPEALKLAVIEEMHKGDSFNGGIVISGMLGGPPTLFDAIGKYHAVSPSLQHSEEGSAKLFPHDPVVNDWQVINARMYGFQRHPQSGKIKFYSRPDQRPRK